MLKKRKRDLDSQLISLADIRMTDKKCFKWVPSIVLPKKIVALVNQRQTSNQVCLNFANKFLR